MVAQVQRLLLASPQVTVSPPRWIPLCKNSSGKRTLNCPKGAVAMAPIVVRETDTQCGVFTQQGRLLCFPIDQIPTLERGKGNKLIQRPTSDLTSGEDAVAHVVLFNDTDELLIETHQKPLTLKTRLQTLRRRSWPSWFETAARDTRHHQYQSESKQ